ncbi:hypothetical protein PoB_005116500 [Plakobranchus ocellatus]|uniref:Uncharacterized protein n=1 Tax=Plakobranchus ocellatus TaxID=259542 RepID=A0AAV4BZW0_9GAST|nr:hypothetical protein PoB_005116500 [Plakobranchus ocellatus]
MLLSLRVGPHGLHLMAGQTVKYNAMLFADVMYCYGFCGPYDHLQREGQVLAGGKQQEQKLLTATLQIFRHQSNHCLNRQDGPLENPLIGHMRSAGWEI